MKRFLAVLVVCACGGVESQAPASAPGAGDGAAARLESCYVVKDDGGAVGFFAAFEAGSSLVPERLDSITFLGQDGTTPVLTWDKGVELKPLDVSEGRRAHRESTRLTTPRLRYATNDKAIDWGKDASRWPLTATVKMGGEIQPSCVLRELRAPADQSHATTLAPADTADDAFYGNCPHCVASFLCGCLELQDELDLCDPPPSPATLDNCSEVMDYLFTPPA